jgi:NADH-quinone oxidoreductase subunit M
MILTWLILIPLVGGCAAYLAGRSSANWARGTALVATLMNLVLTIALWAGHSPDLSRLGSNGPWLAEQQVSWIPQLGISYHLALDGLSLLLVVLTAFIGVISVLISWREIEDRVGLFHGMLLWILAGINGVFMALDLFLFYFFWEVMLVPMYFLIGIWGHEQRVYAAIKFFLFTLTSGLLMLLAILGVYVIHGKTTGIWTFDFPQLLGTPFDPRVAMWLMLGFFVGFAVKLPAVPFHNWLPDAHTEAPTAGSVILAGLLLKTGAYGLIRFVVPLFPGAVERFAPVAMTLGVIGIVYGALVAFSQTDLKRLVAYTSVSHMGFVLLGIFTWNELALQGTVMQMICHGISTGALFILVGMLYERIHTRDVGRMGGLWTAVPRMGAMAMVFAMASLGLPGLGNFVGEFLVLFGAFRAHIPLAIIATVGVVFATIYSLWIVQRAFHGPRPSKKLLPDLSARETVILAVLVMAIVWLGLFPQPVLDTTRPVFEGMTPPVSAAPPPAAKGGLAARLASPPRAGPISAGFAETDMAQPEAGRLP